MNIRNDNDRPVGIFDSGVGGLTVLKAIRAALPEENIVYLGDTARLPYGTKSPVSIARYATQATAQLQAQGIKLLVVACNTASAVALDQLRDRLSPLPVIGVVEPGADAAISARPHASHLVLATEATVRLGAYRRAINARDPDATIREHACEMLVSLAEEGWNDGDIALAIIRRYLEEATVGGFAADTIILGCTHFPLLTDAIRAVADDSVALIDSASTTAGVVKETLASAGLLRDSDEPGATRFLATDGVRRFASVGSRFLGRALTADDVELVDL
jgi:glutamate racemase